MHRIQLTAFLVLIVQLLLCQICAGFVIGNCIQPGRRLYSTQFLFVLPWDLPACWRLRSEINGTYFVRPDNCVDRGGDQGVWAEYYVGDASCDSRWDDQMTSYCLSKGEIVYSKRLWNPQGNDWIAWCEQSPAVVRGIYFSKPTRCFLGFFQTIVYGEFHIPDACCDRELLRLGADETDPVISLDSHTDVTAAVKNIEPRQVPTKSLLQGPDECATDPNVPPVLLAIVISDLNDVIRALQSSDYNPFSIISYLYRFIFFTQSRSIRPPFQPDTRMYAISFDSFNPPVMRFQDSPPAFGAFASLAATFVPTTPSATVFNAGGAFPTGTYLTMDVGSYTGPPRIINTQQLTGCCLAFGWDHRNRRFYMAHVEPDGGIPPISDRVNLANYLRQNRLGQFPGGSSSDIDVTYFGGDGDHLWGYGNTVNVVAFLVPGRVWLLLQGIDSQRQVTRSWLRKFPEI